MQAGVALMHLAEVKRETVGRSKERGSCVAILQHRGVADTLTITLSYQRVRETTCSWAT